MTYRRIEDLPQDVRDYLTEQVQYSFLVAFNRFINRGCDQGSAFQLAWETLSLDEQVPRNRADSSRQLVKP